MLSIVEWPIYFCPDGYMAKLICDGLPGFGHSAFGAGVTVTMVEASNVGVKVGIVGRGVIVAVGVSVGTDVLVFVRVGDGVDVALSTTGTGAV